MKKFFAICILIALLGAGGFMFHAPLLSAYARFFSVANGTQGADALVVLSGGIETRFPRALELYQQGFAPRIVLTDPRLRNERLLNLGCEEKAQADALRRLSGVQAPIEVCHSLKGGATSTFDEAYDVLAYCKAHRFRHIIIVTDHYHTRRALYAFEKIFRGSQIRVEAMGAHNDIFTPDNWWRTDRGIEAYVLELMKCMVYVFLKKNAPFIQNY